jgi:protein O-GlcNAc transferase
MRVTVSMNVMAPPAVHAEAPLALPYALSEPVHVMRLRDAMALETEDRAAALATLHSLAVEFPDWSEPWLRIADSHRRANDPALAEPAYGEVLQREPNRVEALIALGVILLGKGHAIAAQSLLIRACGRAPARAEAWAALGLSLIRTEDWRAAESAFAEARRLDPTRLDFIMHAANASVGAGRTALELARVALEIEVQPELPGLHVLHGLLLHDQGLSADAIDAFETATILAPDDAIVAALYGHALVRGYRMHEAESALRRAMDLNPEDRTVRHDLAAVQMRLHRPFEACALLEQLPQSTSVLCNLATATSARGLQQRAVALARQAIAQEPRSTLARRTLASVLPYAPGVAGAELRAALEDCAATLPRGPRLPPRDPRPDRPLRVALLSGSLRTHPVGWLTITAFESLDRSAFSLLCCGRNSGTDSIGRRFAARAEDWIDIDALSDADAAATLRERQVDLLIDLGGYGDTGRLGVCAHRAAPVQIKWVGMQFHTSGLPEIDWMITDRWETPPDHTAFYSERLLTLPDGYVCYSPPAYAPAVEALPALRNGFVTFGCFNNLAKVTPQVIDTWSRILHRMPDARLMLKAQQFAEPETSEQIRNAFAARGIAEDRLETNGPSSHRRLLEEYNRIDIVLDPFPYSGGLTTCEALWMGVPTITLPGETFASRHALSHLSNVGLADWSVPDTETYIQMALARARDLPALASLRDGLRAQVKASPLCDAARFGRHLGEALQHAWRVACRAAEAGES